MVAIDKRLRFEEAPDLGNGKVCLYFIGDKSLYSDITGRTDEKCVGMTLSIEMPIENTDPDCEELLVSISPTEQDGDMFFDYDWDDIALPSEEIASLIQMWKEAINEQNTKGNY